MAIRKPTHQGLYPQEEARAGVMPFPKRKPSPYPRSTAAYGMAHGGSVVDGYEYEGGINGIQMAGKRKGIFKGKGKGSTPSQKHIKKNPIFQKKVAKKGTSTPSSKSRKINPVFKTKKAARGGKIK
jgi:hypothetical protein